MSLECLLISCSAAFLLCACLVALYFSSGDWDVGMESAVRHFVYTQPKHFSNALPATLGGTKHVLSAHVGPACVWVFGLTYVCFKHLRVCDDRVCGVHVGVWAHICML